MDPSTRVLARLLISVALWNLLTWVLACLELRCALRVFQNPEQHADVGEVGEL